MKVVDFTPLGINNLVNLGFGDLRSNGSVDDIAVSNNGDIVKVLATVIEILKHFTATYPRSIIFFRGSTEERNKLYWRIIKTYYVTFTRDFMILGIIGDWDQNEMVPFEPTSVREYFAFIIKRIA
jgi:hypothetical protein